MTFPEAHVKSSGRLNRLVRSRINSNRTYYWNRAIQQILQEWAGIDLEMSDKALLYFWLFQVQNRGHAAGWASLVDLEKRTGISRPTLIRSLHRLHKRGILIELSRPMLLQSGVTMKSTMRTIPRLVELFYLETATTLWIPKQNDHQRLIVEEQMHLILPSTKVSP